MHCRIQRKRFEKIKNQRKSNHGFLWWESKQDINTSLPSGTSKRATWLPKKFVWKLERFLNPKPSNVCTYYNCVGMFHIYCAVFFPIKFSISLYANNTFYFVLFIFREIQNINGPSSHFFKAIRLMQSFNSIGS